MIVSSSSSSKLLSDTLPLFSFCDLSPVKMYCESQEKAQSHTHLSTFFFSVVLSWKSAVDQILHVPSADVVASKLEEENGELICTSELGCPKLPPIKTTPPSSTVLPIQAPMQLVVLVYLPSVWDSHAKIT